MFPLPEMDPCYLCQVVTGHTTAWNVVEGRALTLTILNGRQFEVGQCMVLPRRHAATLLDLTADERGAVMEAAARVTQAMVRLWAPDGVLLYQNNGVGSGQEVPHFHLHVVPRRPNSDWGLGPPHLARIEREGGSASSDHTVVTEAKRQTVALLRQGIPADPQE